MDANERDVMIRCLANCDDIEKAKELSEVKKCTDKIKELLTGLVIFDSKDQPTVYH